MPAFYTHVCFGKEVAARLPKQFITTILNYPDAFEVGLQGPDLFFFAKPFIMGKLANIGYRMHKEKGQKFFSNALKVIEEKGLESPEFSYLMGFICHYVLDHACHPYIIKAVKEVGVEHLEMEEEWDKTFLYQQGKNPKTYPLYKLISTQYENARAIEPFYEGVSVDEIKSALRQMRQGKKILLLEKPWQKRSMKVFLQVTGTKRTLNGLAYQPQDNPKCEKSNQDLTEIFFTSIPECVSLIVEFVDCVENKKTLDERFNHSFN